MINHSFCDHVITILRLFCLNYDFIIAFLNFLDRNKCLNL